MVPLNTPGFKTKSRVACTISSGHDITVMPLMYALGVWADGNHKWPEYASYICIELHLNGVTAPSSSKSAGSGHPGTAPLVSREELVQQAKVRVLYNGTPVTLPGQDSYDCDYVSFVRIIQPVCVFDDRTPP